MPKKDKNDKSVYDFLKELDYEYSWSEYTDNEYINKALSTASKKGTNKRGYPDYIYVNETRKLLILAEIKPSISQHQSSKGVEDIEAFAVDGILHYLSFFTKDLLEQKSISQYFEHWYIVGLAISGNLGDAYNNRITTFFINHNNIETYNNATEILDENDYISLFENYNEEKTVDQVSSSSKKINKWLRSVDSQKRPILLSALMICLFEKEGVENDFKKGYQGWSAETIVTQIPTTLNRILKNEKIPHDKIELIIDELGFIKHDRDLLSTETLKDILNELNKVIIPLFKKKSNYDVIGKFYEEFLRYAGVAKVKKGIVLTPRHITTLFTELIDIKTNDVFLDPACGTGAFLIAAMNRVAELFEKSKISNKQKAIETFKKYHLIGFEKNATMYSLAVSNMLFRGDGKSRVTYCDFFDQEADTILKEYATDKEHPVQPTIGFVNPPYGGKDNKDNPTKKEIQFLIKMLDSVSRYGIIIAPLSTFFKDEALRNSIKEHHTLKYVINMPSELFMPNAATNTAIAVFETNKPQGDQEVIFYDLKDDGFVLSKSKGRTDTYNRWNAIKNNMLNQIHNPDKYEDGLILVKTKIEDNDEWLIQAHANTDYDKLNEKSFEKAIKDYMIFNAKEQMGIIDKEIDEITLLDVLSNFYRQEVNEET